MGSSDAYMWSWGNMTHRLSGGSQATAPESFHCGSDHHVVGNCDLRNTNSPIEVQALVTADLEGEVSNGRLQLIRKEHPVELTKVLQGLASRGFLDQIGQKRQTSYRLPEWALSPMGDRSSPGFSSFVPYAISFVP